MDMRSPTASDIDTGAGTGWPAALRTGLVLMALCGALYPFAATSVGGLLFPHQARGSLIVVDGRAVGSSLVGQPYDAPGRFHGRPSAAGYDPLVLGGSNLAPSNPALRERVAADAATVAAREGVDAVAVPVDLVAASGSGIDPHISPEAALLQVPRVAHERGLATAAVEALVRERVQGPAFGVIGQPRINVLELNLALDAAT